MNKILLIVGNGLSIDICRYLKLDIDPSSPFSFDVPDLFDSSKKLLDTLTRVKGMIKSYPNTTDFDIIQNFVRSYQENNQENLWLACSPKIGSLKMRDSCKITAGGGISENEKAKETQSKSSGGNSKQSRIPEPCLELRLC